MVQNHNSSKASFLSINHCFCLLQEWRRESRLLSSPWQRKQKINTAKWNRMPALLLHRLLFQADWYSRHIPVAIKWALHPSRDSRGNLEQLKIQPWLPLKLRTQQPFAWEWPLCLVSPMLDSGSLWTASSSRQVWGHTKTFYGSKTGKDSQAGMLKSLGCQLNEYAPKNSTKFAFPDCNAACSPALSLSVQSSSKHTRYWPSDNLILVLHTLTTDIL